MFLVGSVGSHMILHDPMYDPSTILNVLVRWDRKIVRSYDPDRDFDNHALYLGNNQAASSVSP